jgi:hypothetical protein
VVREEGSAEGAYLDRNTVIFFSWAGKENNNQKHDTLSGTKNMNRCKTL